jgi:hypothetical protein
MTVPYGPPKICNRPMLCADIGLPSAKRLLGRLRALCRSWGIEEDLDDAIMARAAEDYGDGPGPNFEADEIIEELSTARRCLSEKHRGPQECIEHIERAMVAVHRA